MFEHIRIGKFLLRLRALDDLHLPAYKGSTLRGGFGAALKHVACALKRQDCGGCLLRDRCVYLYLFRNPAPGGYGNDEPLPGGASPVHHRTAGD